jgi:phytanoyl-CoA hydroxylase
MTSLNLSENEYNENGYVVFKNFLDLDYVKNINDIIDELSEKLTPSDTVFFEQDKIKQIQYLNNYHKQFEDLVNIFMPIAQELTGTKDLRVHNVQLFEKHAQISKPTRAHQDNAYFRVDPANAITFWIALDDIDEENGCLYYKPKSHLLSNILHNRFSSQTTFRIRSGIPGLSLCIPDYDESEDTPIYVGKGDVVIHHCNLIHRAGKNTSQNRRRRAIGIIYIPTECKPDIKLTEHYSALLEEDKRLINDRKNVEK